MRFWLPSRGLPDAGAAGRAGPAREAELLHARRAAQRGVFVQACADPGLRLFDHAANRRQQLHPRSRWSWRSALPKSSERTRKWSPSNSSGPAKRKGHHLLAEGRRAQSAPQRAEGIDRAVFQRDASRAAMPESRERSTLELEVRLGLGHVAADRHWTGLAGGCGGPTSGRWRWPDRAGPRTRTLPRHLGVRGSMRRAGAGHRGHRTRRRSSWPSRASSTTPSLLLEAYHAQNRV